MEYREAVAETRRLDHVIEEAETTAEEAKWRQAELTWEQVRQNGVSTRQWGHDIGKDHSLIVRWAQIWDRWGGDRDHRPLFSEAYNIVRGRDETTTGGSQYAHEARAAVRNMPPEEKAEIIREALAEPEVAEQIIRDPETVERIDRARSDAGRQRLANAGLYRVPDEPADVQTEALAEIQENIHAIKIAYRRIHDLLAEAPLDSAEREQVSVNLTECQRWADLTFRQATDSVSDAEFRALLEEGV